MTQRNPMDKSLKTYYLVRFNRRTGKIDTSMEALGCALLRLWALNNTTKTSQVTFIFDEDGFLDWTFSGKTNDFPTVKKIDGAEHIDSYCEGLLEAMKEG